MQDIAYNLILCFVMNFDFIELAINVYLKLPKPQLMYKNCYILLNCIN